MPTCLRLRQPPPLAAGLARRPRPHPGTHPPRSAAPPAGGEGAPDLQETVQNFGINSAALGVLGFFVYRDVSAARRDQAVVEREEALARLQVRADGTGLLLGARRPACARVPARVRLSAWHTCPGLRPPARLPGQKAGGAGAWTWAANERCAWPAWLHTARL